MWGCVEECGGGWRSGPGHCTASRVRASALCGCEPATPRARCETGCAVEADLLTHAHTHAGTPRFTGLPLGIPESGSEAGDGDPGGAGEQGSLPATAEALKPRPGAFSVATFAFDFVLKAEIIKKEDNSVVDVVGSSGPHFWRFIRGPMPSDMPVRALDLDWTLISV